MPTDSGDKIYDTKQAFLARLRNHFEVGENAFALLNRAAGLKQLDSIDSQRPLFGTIVLDEAFSKSFQAVAGRIIRALAEFGLHPLFVTPNKELRLLREHTRSAIVVHRKGTRATMTSLSWEALEAHARNRAQRQEHDVEVA